MLLNSTLMNLLLPLIPSKHLGRSLHLSNHLFPLAALNAGLDISEDIYLLNRRREEALSGPDFDMTG